MLTSDKSTNMKIPKNFIFKNWKGGECVPLDEIPEEARKTKALPFTPSLNSLVHSEKHQSIMSLKKLVLDHYPTCHAVYGSKPWVAGQLPSLIEMKKDYYFHLDEEAVAVNVATKDLKQIKLMPSVKYNENKSKFEPVGLLLIGLNQIIVQAVDVKTMT